MKKEHMHFDVIIVGGGPAGLTAAIRLAQLNRALSICVLEKGIEIGAHTLSGAVLDPIALQELFPDWQTRQPPEFTSVTKDRFVWLTEKKAYRLPTPRPMKNDGNYIISLSQWVKWLAKEAEKLDIHIFCGFAATRVLYSRKQVVGVCTGDMGVDADGHPTAHYQPGIELYASQTLFAEGCRGSLSEELIATFNLRAHAEPQTYGLGFKEIWELDPLDHHPGFVQHSIGWPLNRATYGGSFLYHYGKKRAAVGFVVGLDYSNPYLNPYEEFQQFKTHPSLYPLFSRGKRLLYGARTLNEGGIQSIPKLFFPGGLLIGCSAGFLNVPRIKGIHTAMKSALLAAESIHSHLKTSTPSTPCSAYASNVKRSWLYKELHQVRNIRPAMRFGLFTGLIYSAIDTYLLRGHAPWTFKILHDHLQLKKAAFSFKKSYPKHDQRVTFDLLSSVYLTHIRHEENQPCHLKLKNIATPIAVNQALYDGPEARYCPAGVYEYLKKENEVYLQINSANCIHCKACDIKDPTQNIQWTPPEGGSGPQYNEM